MCIRDSQMEYQIKYENGIANRGCLYRLKKVMDRAKAGEALNLSLIHISWLMGLSSDGSSRRKWRRYRLYAIPDHCKWLSLIHIYDRECGGRNRRYYKITEPGQDKLVEYRREWEDYSMKISDRKSVV